MDKRLVFDAIPEQFDRWRVRYSPALFGHILETCGLGPGMRCLEIGPGTGQATDFALEAGLDYLGVELGEHLAAFMRRKYGGYPNFHLIQGDFETCQLPDAAFDLAYSAAAIQWIDQDVAYRRCFEALKDGGWLAMFLLVSKRADPALDREVNEVYDTYFVSEQPYRQKFDYMAGESYGFTFVEQRDFPGRRVYTSDEYLDYIGTHSDHITLHPQYREAFYGGIRDAILRHGDRIEVEDAYRLFLYRKPESR